MSQLLNPPVSMKQDPILYRNWKERCQRVEPGIPESTIKAQWDHYWDGVRDDRLLPLASYLMERYGL